MATTVTSKGQVTIPKSVRDHLGLEPGSAVEFELADDGRFFLVRADGARPASRFEKFLGISDTGMSTDEIMALMRGDD
jgi:AbrB family looped-hinge helix DNA binding protein